MQEIYTRESWYKFHSYNKENGLNFSHAKNLLLDVKEILDKNNIDFILVFGTLLGAYRENNFIEHDTDIDIGIVGENDIEKIKKILLSGGFLDKGIKLIYGREFSLCRDNIYIDIYPFIKDGDGYRSKLGWQVNYRLSEEDFPFQKINFLGENFLTVNEIEKYLIHRYGSDWKQPIKNKHALR